MNLLQHFLEKMARESSAPFLFAQRPRLDFRPAQSDCPDCQARLKVKKTRIKTVFTLHLGGFDARETLLQCDQCPNPTIYGSEELSRLVPVGSTFGYDGVTLIGRALFQRHRCALEIVGELRARNVRLSASEVAYLGKKFVVYLAMAHRQSAPRLKAAMRDQGGYILHLDGTCEGGGPMLMSSLDSISEIVLGNLKVPSEKTAEIIPFLKEIKSRYGIPLALVHDMGAGILAAVQEVFTGVPDFICHFHFLRDAGKDLLAADYDAIRQRLRHHAITDKLQYGFPFDRPQLEFAQRLLAVSKALEPIKDIHLRGQWRDNIPLFKLSCQLRKIAADSGLEKMIAAIQPKIQVFDQLRGAMRIAEAQGSAGLNSGGASLAMGPIRKAVQKFRHQMTSRSDYPSAPHWRSLIAQIDKYGDKLFADPITVQTPHGPQRIQPQRTNNIMERFFRDFRRGVRRKSGHNSLSTFLQSMIADTPLVRNLDNPRYMKILLEGQPNLETRFAQMDTQAAREEMLAAGKCLDRVPANIPKLIATPVFPDALYSLFRKPLVANSN